MSELKSCLFACPLVAISPDLSLVATVDSTTFATTDVQTTAVTA